VPRLVAQRGFVKRRLGGGFFYSFQLAGRQQKRPAGGDVTSTTPACGRREN
jgi:hypothetical protein